MQMRVNRQCEWVTSATAFGQMFFLIKIIAQRNYPRLLCSKEQIMFFYPKNQRGQFLSALFSAI